MNQPTGSEISAFFEEFAQRSGEPAAVDEFFDRHFLSLDPTSSSVVEATQLAAALPARAAMFRSVGAVRTDLTALTEQPLDESHCLVSTTWSALDEDGQEVLALSSSFLLRRTERGWRIAVYLNHADIGRVIAQRHTPTETQPPPR